MERFSWIFSRIFNDYRVKYKYFPNLQPPHPEISLVLGGFGLANHHLRVDCNTRRWHWGRMNLFWRTHASPEWVERTARGWQRDAFGSCWVKHKYFPNLQPPHPEISLVLGGFGLANHHLRVDCNTKRWHWGRMNLFWRTHASPEWVERTARGWQRDAFGSEIQHFFSLSISKAILLNSISPSQVTSSRDHASRWLLESSIYKDCRNRLCLPLHHIDVSQMLSRPKNLLLSQVKPIILVATTFFSPKQGGALHP